MIKSSKIVQYHLFYFIKICNLLKKLKNRYTNISKNIIILAILEKGGNTIMRVLLIKILVVILLQIVIILIQEFWK